MFVTLRRLAGAASTSLLLLAFSASAADIPARKPGLWALKSEAHSYANWSMCVDDSKTNFLDSDVWQGFDKECTTTATRKEADKNIVEATCRLSETSEAKMTLTYAGDFNKAYRFESVTSFKAAGEHTSQTILADVTYQGECPAELKPGMKKMEQTGIIIGK